MPTALLWRRFVLVDETLLYPILPMIRENPRRPHLPGWLTMCTLLFLIPSTAYAHGALARSTPASGDVLVAAPTELRLTFTEAVELSVARLTLTGPDGIVALAPLTFGDSVTTIIGAIRGPLVPGGYTVKWQVTGADGHPVQGEYTFSIAPEATGLAQADTAPVIPAVTDQPPVTSTPAAAPAETSFNAGSPLYAMVRWLTFLGTLGLIGAVAFRLLVLPMVGRGDPAHRAAWFGEATQGALRFGLTMVGITGVAAILRLYAQSYALNGADALDPERLSTILTGTIWGWGWLLQVAGVALGLVGLVLARSSSRAGWTIAALGALALAFSPALSGHAVATPGLAGVAVLADGLHVLGAGGWLGSLLVVAVVGIPAAMRRAPGERGVAVAALINGFSPTALFFAGMLVATGVLAAWLHLGSFPMLWQSGYGKTLLVKVAVLSLVFGTAAYNFLRVKPSLGDDIATARLRRSVTVELAIALVVLAVTAVLVATPPPQ